MKTLIASDIHGSAWYCRLLLECVRKEKAERLLLLGDLLYHGPRNALPRDYAPMEVASMLNTLPIPVFGVRGNCDAEIDGSVLEIPVMADYSLLLSGRRTVFATHGHIYTPESHPRLGPGSAFLFGHIHTPVCKEREGVLYLNPGSVSIPKEDSPHSCMSFADGSFRWHDLETGEAYMQYDWEG